MKKINYTKINNCFSAIKAKNINVLLIRNFKAFMKISLILLHKKNRRNSTKNDVEFPLQSGSLEFQIAL